MEWTQRTVWEGKGFIFHLLGSVWPRRHLQDKRWLRFNEMNFTASEEWRFKSYFLLLLLQLLVLDFLKLGPDGQHFLL